jgi:transposase
MHKSTLSLQLWFFAIYLMSSTRCGISAKQLEREIGVMYKTAHRMFKQIRTLLSDESEGPLSGDVEADESKFGGSRAPTRNGAGKATTAAAVVLRSWRWSSVAAACGRP